jgi:AdoMet-dependent rRNA methyltransferase SPB1
MDASSEEDESVDDDGDVDMDGASVDDDDFEIVPQTKDDGPAWDVDDEDQDEVKKQLIRGGLTHRISSRRSAAKLSR